MPPKDSSDSELDKTHPLLHWAHEEASTLPTVSPSNPTPPALDGRRWPDWIRQAPNPTLFTQQNLNRKDGHLPHFYRAFTFVLFLVPEVFFHHIYPRVVCPGCNSSEKVKPKGWCEGLRRVASSHGTFFLYGRRYSCEGCHGGFNIFDEKVLKSLPACIVNQLPFILTRKGAIQRSEMDRLDRALVKGTSVREYSKSMLEMNMKRYVLLYVFRPTCRQLFHRFFFMHKRILVGVCFN
jgi:transposase-like protein